LLKRSRSRPGQQQGGRARQAAGEGFADPLDAPVIRAERNAINFSP
jgi:hypothetical protein